MLERIYRKGDRVEGHIGGREFIGEVIDTIDYGNPIVWQEVLVRCDFPLYNAQREPVHEISVWNEDFADPDNTSIYPEGHANSVRALVHLAELVHAESLHARGLTV